MSVSSEFVTLMFGVLSYQWELQGNEAFIRNNYFAFELTGSIILPVVLYGCESWSLALREESRLRVLENRVLGGGHMSFRPRLNPYP